MMDSDDREPDLSEEPKKKERAESEVDLETDRSLVVDISDALSEQDKVKYTVHTKTTLQTFKKSEFSVIREHEEFVWLHDRFTENEDYAGIMIPPPPPRPNFDEPRVKLAKLREGEATMTKEEYNKMKQELEAEYLAMFKKTVAMHEVFLQRLTAHPRLRGDSVFTVFLEFDGDLSIRQKNTRERLGSIFKGLAKGVDEMYLQNHKDVDEYFENEKVYLTEYNTQLHETIRCADKATKAHKALADSFIGIAAHMSALPYGDKDPLLLLFKKSGDSFEKLRKLEARTATDEDLKLTDLLRYYERDTKAALGMMYRRIRSLANLQNSTKALDKAKQKGKAVTEAENNQKKANEKFEQYSEIGKQELADFKSRRIVAFKKHLVELTELEVKHAKVNSTQEFLIFIICLKI